MDEESELDRADLQKIYDPHQLPFKLQGNLQGLFTPARMLKWVWADVSMAVGVAARGCYNTKQCLAFLSLSK